MDFKQSTKMYINEGMMYFKYSKRFKILAKKMKESLDVSPDKEEINNFIDELELASKDFQEIENEYKTDKYTAMQKYPIIKEQYKHLIKKAKKETIKKFLIGIGAFGALGSILHFLENK